MSRLVPRRADCTTTYTSLCICISTTASRRTSRIGTRHHGIITTHSQQALGPLAPQRRPRIRDTFCLPVDTLFPALPAQLASSCLCTCNSICTCSMLFTWETSDPSTKGFWDQGIFIFVRTCTICCKIFMPIWGMRRCKIIGYEAIYVGGNSLMYEQTDTLLARKRGVHVFSARTLFALDICVDGIKVMLPKLKMNLAT